MKELLSVLLTMISLKMMAQRTISNPNEFYRHIFESKSVQISPAFAAGPDACQHFYFAHFKGFDSLIAGAVAHGDTAKYLRVYFSFIVDKNGVAYDAMFIKIASTQYAKSAGTKTVSYFVKDKNYFEKMIQQMILVMPLWKPALQDGVMVSCRVENYFQFWVGLSPAK